METLVGNQLVTLANLITGNSKIYEQQGIP